MSKNDGEDDVEIEYVYEAPPQDDLFKNFVHIFQKFSQLDPNLGTNKSEADDENNENKIHADAQDDNKKALIEAKAKKDAEEEKTISKRKLRQMTRISVAELKQQVARPELVELHDVTARDPLFLLQLKSTKNSVPVPRHWNTKRRYLQGKRGYEKPPFLLPDFIRKTGIMEMRDSIQDKDTGKSLKSKTRERVQPKIGKIQMDYQQLHDAFFKWQTKPDLTIHGDLYYEGKEFEKKFKYKPGELSNELRRALGMPTGPDAHRFPPPWAAAMERHGPPPSYPYLRPSHMEFENANLDQE